MNIKVSSKEALERILALARPCDYEVREHRNIYCDMLETVIKQDLDRLEEYRKIEEVIGIGLITLYRALICGIYYKEDNHIFFTNNIVLVSNELVQVKPTYAIKEATIKSCYYGDCEPLKYLKDAHYWDWKTCNHWKLKDYGVTWSLTKEALEQ